VKLRELLEDTEGVGFEADPEAEVSGLAYDSRRVRPGDLFFALPGLRSDGRTFAAQALAAGAVAVVAAREAAPEAGALVRVEAPRRTLALAAARFFGFPSRRLKVVGVTGTNGKTTTTYLMESIFRAAGIPAGLIGTTGYRLGAEWRPAPLTTPEAPELESLLREFVDRSLEGVAIELSSHALEQQRCYGLECDVAVFTNLSHDHLDYHGTLERYLDAKLRLFDGRNHPRALKRATAVVNDDDPRGPDVRRAAERGGLAVLGYGTTAGAGVTIGPITPLPRGLRFELRHEGNSVPVTLPLLGRYNAWNAAAAFGAARALGVAPALAARGLEETTGVPGRLEPVDEGQSFEVLVDYAHTPDALARALQAVREHARGRLLLVFGCGGDRDRAKRPLMGKVAAEASDHAWVTNDNPRREAPESIAAEILAGAPPGSLGVELDRRAAIERAIERAAPGDAVLIAGKGHETTQTIGARVLPFDDRAVARELLRARRAPAGGGTGASRGTRDSGSGALR